LRDQIFSDEDIWRCNYLNDLLELTQK
jgi:hypothetical protein